MIIEQNDVELLSIKIKTARHIDSEIQTNSDNNLRSQPFSKRRESSKISQDYDQEHHYNNNDNHANDDDAWDDHYESTVRLLQIDKTANGACGFHLTRTKWDPYPWVSGVDCFSPAEKIGLKAGDCVLEVNGCDVLGLRITEIAKLVKSSERQVTLLLWNSKCNSDCSDESLCAAPMPRSLQRLSAVVQCVLSLLECPVCLENITPPAMQCQNGHLLCLNCRIRAVSCPVCRDRYYPRPALIAEQLQTAITSAFDLCANEDKVRQKIFGRHNRQLQMVKTTLQCAEAAAASTRQQVHKSLETSMVMTMTMALPPDGGIGAPKTKEERGKNETDPQQRPAQTTKRKKTARACNKLLTKLLNFKSYSMENLTNNNTAMDRTITAMTTTTNATSFRTSSMLLPGLDTGGGVEGPHRHQLNTNQLEDFIATTVGRPKQLSLSSSSSMTTTYNDPIVDDNDVEDINSNPDCCKQMFSNGIRHFSLSSSDLTMNSTQTTTAAATAAAAGTARTRTKSTHESCPLASTSSRTFTANTTSSATSILNKSSPIWFQQRPFRKYNRNLCESIPRAFKPQSLKSAEMASSLARQNCHHVGDDDDDAGNDDDDDTSGFTSHNSTPSTLSLKSCSSSSGWGGELPASTKATASSTKSSSSHFKLST